jgi:hypothetical protein
MRLSKEGIDNNMFGKFMLHRIIGNLDGSCVLSQRRGVAASQGMPKSANNH